MNNRDRVLRHVLEASQDAPATVTDETGYIAPISDVAAMKLRNRLVEVTGMHANGELTDAQMAAAVQGLLESFKETSILHHRMSPVEMETARMRALDAIAL